MAKRKALKNPYGIRGAKSYKVARVERGGRIHLINPQTGAPYCDHTLHADFSLTSPKIQRNEFDCYRCIKISYMNHNKKALLDRNFRPSEPSKREKHLMLTGGRQGRYVGSKTPKNKDRLDKLKMTGHGYMADDISDKYGPEHLEYVSRGSDYAPAQVRLIPFGKVRGMSQAKKAAAKYKKVANPAVSFRTKDGRKVSFTAKKNPAVSFRTKDGRSVSFTTKKNGKKSGGRR